MSNVSTKIKSVVILPLKYVTTGSMRNKLRFWILFNLVTFLSIAVYFFSIGWQFLGFVFILTGLFINEEIYKLDQYENPQDYPHLNK